MTFLIFDNKTLINTIETDTIENIYNSEEYKKEYTIVQIDKTQKYENGEIVMKSDAEKFADGIITLEEYKELKIAEIDKARNEYCQTPISYNNYEFRMLEEDQALMSRTLSAYADALPENFAWISIDNRMMPCARDDLQKIAELVANRTSLTFIKARLLKDKILTSKDGKDIESIKLEL